MEGAVLATTSDCREYNNEVHVLWRLFLLDIEHNPKACPKAWDLFDAYHSSIRF